MSFAHLTSAETSFLTTDEPFTLESGERLPGATIAYRTWGAPRRTATLVCHALTGSADADDWWAGLFGPGRALDPETGYIVCANVLGGCYGTTGPSGAGPHGVGGLGPAFPTVTIRDMVRLQARLLDHLGVERLDLVIGGSMGGMQALEWAASLPDRVDAIAPIGVTPVQTAWAGGRGDAQRQAIEADADFAGGLYHAGAGPRKGLAAARTIAMISYRSPQNFETRRDGQGDGAEGVRSYLRYQGDKLVERFDANSYLTLLAAMDTHDLGRGRSSVRATLQSIDQPALVVGISSDELYPAKDVAAMAGDLGNAEYHEIVAPHGHDAFLIEIGELNDRLVEFTGRYREPTEEPLAVHC